MSERLFRIDDQCALDEYFNLHHPDGVLKPCQIILDKEILIGIVDNNTINFNRLMLRGDDYRDIVVQIPKNGEVVKVVEPGKTGIIYFGGQINTSRFRSDGLFYLGGGIDRRDHLHIAKVGDINSIGWKVYWAPLQMSGHMRHVRMVSLNGNGEVSENEAKALASVFKKHI